MKNYLLGVATVLLLGLLSFNKIEDIFTIKPALPKSVMSVTVDSDNVDSVILNYTKKGYILKSVTTMGGSYAVNVVMEKY